MQHRALGEVAVGHGTIMGPPTDRVRGAGLDFRAVPPQAMLVAGLLAGHVLCTIDEWMSVQTGPLVIDTHELGRRPGNERTYHLSVEVPAQWGYDVYGVPEGSLIDLELRLGRSWTGSWPQEPPR